MTIKVELKQRSYVGVGVAGVVLGLVGYGILNHFTNSLYAADAVSFLSVWSPPFMLALLLHASYCVFAFFKVNGWLKFAMLICAAMSMLLLGVAAFFYGFARMYS